MSMHPREEVTSVTCVTMYMSLVRSDPATLHYPKMYSKRRVEKSCADKFCG